MRAFLFVLVLAAPALAGPGSWKAVAHGDATQSRPEPSPGTGNAEKLEVLAHDLLTTVEAYAHTSPFASDQTGSAKASSTSWYSLVFVGSNDTTDHRWQITTEVRGRGDSTAYGDLDGSAWSESLQVVAFSGDNDNQGVGMLAVDDTGGVQVILAVPAGLGITFTKSVRSQEADMFDVRRPKSTAGKGKACRVRVDSYAEARVSATCSIGLAHTWTLAELRGDLVMTGTSVWKGVRVEDTFRIQGIPALDPTQEVTPPSGGLEEDTSGKVPTDEPTEDEREGRKDDLPVKDAKDLSGAETAKPGDSSGKTAPAK